MANTQIQITKKYHIIYKTTNLINQKFYIGAHSTNDINDGYLGSGFNLNDAFKKYGKQNFTREILHTFDSPSMMFDKEKEIVTPSFLSRPDVYNIVEGGYGGSNKGAKGLKHMHHPITKERIAVDPNAIEKMLTEGFVLGRGSSPTSNKIWIHNTTDKKMIDPSELDSYLTAGWIKGLPKSPTKNKIWIFNVNLEEYSLCDTSELPSKLEQGWVKKKWSPRKKGSIFVNNGILSKRVEAFEISNYLASGWVKGRMKTNRDKY
jgi:hypothetical protein